MAIWYISKQGFTRLTALRMSSQRSHSLASDGGLGRGPGGGNVRYLLRKSVQPQDWARESIKAMKVEFKLKRPLQELTKAAAGTGRISQGVGLDFRITYSAFVQHPYSCLDRRS